MSETKQRGITSTQENGTTAMLSWAEPLDAEEARALLDLFEIGVRPLRRIAGYERGTLPISPDSVCRCAHAFSEHQGAFGAEGIGCTHIMGDDEYCNCQEFEKGSGR